MTPIQPIIETDLNMAVETAVKGGLILYPTDTVWGIGCDATNADAVQRIYKLKQRIDSKAMIVLVDSTEMLRHYVSFVPRVALQLSDNPTRPTTIIYDHCTGLAPGLLGNDGSIGIRVTHEKFSAELCRRLQRPVVSTSANISGAPTPHCFNDITAEITDGVDYIANYRRDDDTPHSPSRVIKLLHSGEIHVLRH